MISFKIAVILSTLILVSCNHLHNSKAQTKFDAKHKSKISYKASTSSQFLEVKTENGVVLGTKMNDMHVFKGIPYAKPPLGNLRFEPPQKPNKWNGTRNATFYRHQCIQTNLEDLLTFSNSSGSEDCLYLNVFTPQNNEGTKLPVMVWIHGGVFLTGNGSSFESDDMVEEDVVLVTFNYRLGIIGFLSTGDDAAHGNIGLQDQIFALKWVQNNIKQFGGDPSNVTIFGESAGSASVSYLVISPMAKGLFQRGIMESGTVLSPWALSRTAREAAYEVAARLPINAQNSRDLVHKLKRVPVHNLQWQALRVMLKILFRDPFNGLIFAPVIERRSQGAVVPSNMYESLDRGDFNRVPQIIGYNSFEFAGFLKLSPLILYFGITNSLVPSRLVPLDMNANKSELDTIGTKIRNFYIDPNRGLMGFMNYLSDNEFVRSIQKTVNLTSKYTTCYMYKFSYTTNPGAKGAGHTDELSYLFNSDKNSTSDRKIRECMVKAWTNFAKTGNPTPDNENTCANVTWKPLKPNDRSEMYYLNINRTTTSGQNPNRESILFWDDLYAKYGNRPYDTY